MGVAGTKGERKWNSTKGGRGAGGTKLNPKDGERNCGRRRLRKKEMGQQMP